MEQKKIFERIMDKNLLNLIKTSTHKLRISLNSKKERYKETAFRKQ